jgi:ankyrin repeat protein
MPNLNRIQNAPSDPTQNFLQATQPSHASVNDTRLFDKLKSGSSVDELLNLIHADAPLNVQDRIDGYTPLHLALSYLATPEVILAMLEKGAPLNVQNNRGQTPLHLALSYDTSPKVILAMLEKDTSLDAEPYFGNTSLHIALQYHAAPEQILAMLEKGVSLNVQNNRGQTPLENALTYGAAPEVILAMLEIGAPLNVQNSGGSTPLHTALDCHAAPEVILAMLKKGAPLDLQNNRGITPLQLLIQARERALKVSYANALIGVIDRDKAVYETVDLPDNILSTIHPKLTQRGPIDAKGNTILHTLLRNKYPGNVVAAFLEGGARTDIPNQAGETAMSIGLSDQVSAEVRALFQTHANAVLIASSTT